MTVVAADGTTSRLAAGLLVVAGAGHLLAIPHHADPGHGGPWQAAGFALVAVAQLGGAAALAVRPLAARRRSVVLVATAVLVGLWGVSRTVGLPYGSHPGIAEAVGWLDASTVTAQLGVVGLLARTGTPRRARIAMATSSAAIVFGLAAFGIVADSPPARSGHDHPEAEPGHGHPVVREH